MPYNKLLMKIYSESNYSSKEIVEECNKRGQKIDKTYFSKLLNGRVPPPSEEISRVISNICNVDERLLVIEGYIDKAPKEILEAFKKMQIANSLINLNTFENKFDEATINEIIKAINNETLAEYVLSLIDVNQALIENYMKNISVGTMDNDFPINITEPISIEVLDNSMSPLIPKNAKYTLMLQEKYSNNDILAIKVKNSNTILIRYTFFDKDNVLLLPLNRDFETITYEKKDITILGKIDKVIITIQ